ncbi:MAG: Ig-like domain-containing protein, partial [Bacteriovoracaceae bacterium]|nr:Ig-like domain-containing protein [Bacteriovoracaceae bacterium]
MKERGSSNIRNKFCAGVSTGQNSFHFFQIILLSFFLFSCGRAGNKALDPDGLTIGGDNKSNPNIILCYTGQPCSQDLVLRAVSGSDGLPGLQVTFTEQTSAGLLIQTPVLNTDLDGYARTSIIAPLFPYTDAVVNGTIDGYADPTPFTVTVKLGAHHFLLTQGNSQSAVVNQAVALNPMVRVVDITGTPVPNWDVVVTVTSGNGSVSQSSFKTDSSGFAQVTWTLGSTIGTNTINFSAPIIFGAPSSMSFTATGTPDAPHNFLLSGTNSFVAGTCNAYTVYSRDQFNNLSPATAPISVNLTGAASGTFYSDSSCTGGNEITSTTIGIGSDNNVFYYRNTVRESVTLNVDDAGALIAATLGVSIVSDVADHIVISSGNGQSGVASTTIASNPVVQVQDQFNNPVENESVTFAVTAGGGSVTPSNATTDNNGQASFSLTLGTVIGLNSVLATSVNAVGAPSSVTVNATASSDVPHNILFTGVDPIVAGVCSGPYTLTSRDQFNNLTDAISNITLTLSDLGSSTAYSDASCTGGNEVTSRIITTGTNNITFYLRDTLAETITIAADDGGALVDSTFGVTVNPAPANHLDLAGPTPIPTSTCSGPYTIVSQDQFNNNSNLTSNTTINITGGGAGTFYSDSACTGGNEVTNVQISTGTYTQSFYFSDPTGQGLTLNVDDAGALIAGTLPIVVDNGPPTDNTANLQFTNQYEATGNNIAVTWTAFTDDDLTDHKLITYTDSNCIAGADDHGYTSSTVNNNNVVIDGLTDGLYWAKVVARDNATNETTSACSTDFITIDLTNPTDNTANLQFTNAYDNDGNDVAVTWTAFTDTNLSDHRLTTYTDSACSVGQVVHPLTGSISNVNSTVIDGLADGIFYATVTAIDFAGNETTSACSSDSIIIDSTSPTDNTANLQFTNAYNNTGNNVAIIWTAFTDLYLTDHRIITYTNAACSTGANDHGLISGNGNSDSVIVDGLTDGIYYATVTAYDAVGNSTVSACSTDTIEIDRISPTDNTANVQFTDLFEATGNNLAVTWTAFTDINLSDHQIYTYTNGSCSSGEVDHGLTGSTTNSNNTIIDGLSDGQYWIKVKAIDIATNTTTSACSTDFITVDLTNPTDNTANLQFTDTYDNDGNNIGITWTAFSDTNLSDHRLTTYTDSACSLGQAVHPLTGSTTNANSTVVDGLADGIFYATVTAIDSAGNETTSACSSDSIIVDSTAPTDNTANLQFTNAYNNSGNNVAITWTAFTDLYLTDHRLITYTNAACSTGANDHGLIGGSGNSDSVIVDGLTDGVYYATVTAYDAVGNSTVSACSTDTIEIDTTPPTDNTANLQFADVYDIDGNNIDVSWTAFTDSNLSDHTLFTYTDSACSTGEVNHGLIGGSGDTNNTIIDGLSDGIYYAKVRAHDLATNTTTSTCSSDSIIVDTTAPTDNTANLQFTNIYDNDGNDIAVTWTAFTDTYLSNHRIITYTNATCSAGANDHGLIGGTGNSDSVIVDGLIDGTYYATVTAYDAVGNSTVSACSTDTIIVDSTAPTDNTANLQFTNAYNNTGNNVAITWTAFTDSYLSDHRLITYTNALCSTGANDHGLIGGSGNSDSVIVDGLTDGVYYATVTAYDAVGNSTVSACSTDTIEIDTTPPTDNTANLQFADVYDIDGNNIDVSWTAFTDSNLSDHTLFTYTDASCTTSEVNHGLIGGSGNTNNTIIDGLSDGIYYAKVRAHDLATNTTTSACSTDSIIVDTTAPTDNTANLQFTDVYDNDGNDIAVTWTAFTDTYLSDHRLITYTDSGCSVGADDHGLIGGSGNSDSVIIDGLIDGTYYATVTAYDAVGNSTVSACSTDTIIVDSTAPTDNTANLQFTNAYNNTGNNVAITWTAFTDTYLSDHRLITYTNAACTTGANDHGLIGGSGNSDSVIVDGLTDGVYYATVTAYDAVGNSTVSACSTDTIEIDTTPPTDNTANLQFTNVYDIDGDNIDVSWTAFTDSNLSDHRLYTYTDSACSAGVVDHGLIGGSGNTNNTIIDGLTDGQYWAKVEAVDLATNTTVSACSSDSIIVDTTAPTDNTANLQFTNVYDNDGNDIAVTWTAFTDTYLSDHRLITYTDSGCSAGADDHGLIGGTGNSDSVIIDGLVDGTYYATV